MYFGFADCLLVLWPWTGSLLRFLDYPVDLFALSGLILLPTFACLFTLPFGLPLGVTVNVLCLFGFLDWVYVLEILSFLGTLFVRRINTLKLILFLLRTWVTLVSCVPYRDIISLDWCNFSFRSAFRSVMLFFSFDKVGKTDTQLSCFKSSKLLGVALVGILHHFSSAKVTASDIDN